MRSQPGQIISISADAAIISLQPVAACPRCAAGQGCGAGIFAQMRKGADADNGRLVRLHPAAVHGRHVGDRVCLELPESTLLQASLYAYGLPLLAMLMALGGSAMLLPHAPELLHLLTAGLGLAGGLAYGRRWSAAQTCLHRMQPVVVDATEFSVPSGG